MTDFDQDAQSVANLAVANGLAVDPLLIRFNETGLDFRVGFATAEDGSRWVLRLPRRPDVIERARAKARTLDMVRSRFAVAVPHWRIFSDSLIAYPMLPGEPGLTFDPKTHEVTWYFDQASPLFPQTLGRAIAQLHAIPHEIAREAGMPMFGPDEVRQKWLADLDRVRDNFDIVPHHWAAWQSWIADDSYWPDFTVPIHGDLYVGHVMVDAAGRAVGIIDWTEARVGDPAVDLVGNIRAFGEAALPALIEAYSAAGGRTWLRMEEHCHKLNSASAINYALYALATDDPGHRVAAQAQLTPATSLG